MGIASTIMFHHIFREVNGDADWLAHFAHCVSSPVFRSSSPSPLFSSSLVADNFDTERLSNFLNVFSHFQKFSNCLVSIIYYKIR